MSGETVPANTINALIDRLEGLMRRFEPGNGLRAQKLLAQLGRRRFPDAASLIRFHEILVFLRAYPHTPAVRLTCEELLAAFHKRVTRLRLGCRRLGLCRPGSVKHRGYGIFSNLEL